MYKYCGQSIKLVQFGIFYCDSEIVLCTFFHEMESQGMKKKMKADTYLGHRAWLKSNYYLKKGPSWASLYVIATMILLLIDLICRQYL